MLFSVLCLATGAYAQDAVEAAYVRGHFSDGDGVWRAGDFGWFYYDPDEDRGGEELIVDVQGRTVEKGHITLLLKDLDLRVSNISPGAASRRSGFWASPIWPAILIAQFTDRGQLTWQRRAERGADR